jgi:hypothetical protein
VPTIHDGDADKRDVDRDHLSQAGEDDRDGLSRLFALGNGLMIACTRKNA